MMNKALYGATALTLCASLAQAGGIGRSSTNYSLLFDDATQFQLGASIVSPDVSGDYPAALGGGSTGNMAKRYATASAAYKRDFGEKLSLGLFVNHPYGANAEYSQGVYTGLRAEWNSTGTTAVLKFQATDRISVFGGGRNVSSTAQIAIPELLVRRSVGNNALALGAEAATLAAEAAALAATDPAAAAALGAQAAALGARATTLGTAVNPLANPLGDPGLNYTAEASTSDWGYVLGAAYEIPDIALRVSLTWESEIVHEFDTTEMLPTLGVMGTGTTEVTMPQSLALDFQTGVAQGTLVFGGIKWTEWSKWEVRTPGYESVTGGNVTGFDNDTFTYRLGVGRQFSDSLSGFAQMSYEKSNGGVASRLAPTDGRFSIGIGGQVTGDMGKMRFGIEYVKLGDATDSTGVEFTGNSAIGVGAQYTMSF